MKPLNYDNSPCSPISSNCVIWQGPDIPCIKLCSGDTISDVVFKLATELCTVLDTLDVTNYDLSCFNLTACGPNDFHALIQFLIEQICALQTEVNTLADPSTSPIVNTTKSTGVDTLVTVAPCFVIGNVTVMTVSEYAQAIGTKVCSLVSEIALIQASITNLDIRVTNLEAAPAPVFTLPSIPVDCTLSGTIVSPGSYVIDQVLNALINDDTYGYCALKAATGEPTAITSAVLSQCIADTDLSLVYGTQFQVAYAGAWVTSANLDTAADAINNLWLAVCDLYNYIAPGIDIIEVATPTIKNNIIKVSPNLFTIESSIKDSGWVDLEGFNFYTGGFQKPQVRRIGNQFNFRGDVYIPLDNPASTGNVVTLNSATAYNGINGCVPFTGLGGCTLAGTESLLFNNAASVIPTSLSSNLAVFFDGNSYLNYEVAYRPINLDGTYGSVLSAVITVELTTTGELIVHSLSKLEGSLIRTAALGSSHLRLITSNVLRTFNVPNNSGATTTIQNAPSSATYTPDLDAFSLTWPFDCNAGNANELGGFYFKIDGLKAYLNVCALDAAYTGYVCP